MSVMLFFLRYSSCRFTQFSKSDNVLIRFTLNANTSTPRMRLMMDTSLSSLPQQFSFLIAAKSDCLDLAMTISSVSRAIVLPDLRRVSCYPVQGIRQTLIALLCFTTQLPKLATEATFKNSPQSALFVFFFTTHTPRLVGVCTKLIIAIIPFPQNRLRTDDVSVLSAFALVIIHTCFPLYRSASFLWCKFLAAAVFFLFAAHQSNFPSLPFDLLLIGSQLA